MQGFSTNGRREHGHVEVSITWKTNGHEKVGKAKGRLVAKDLASVGVKNFLGVLVC